MKTEKELRELFYKNAHTVVETSYADTDNFMDIDSFIKAVGELNLCNLPVVSQQSELLSNFASYLNETYNLNIEIDDQDVESFLKIAL